MPVKKTEAFVLKSFNWSESSRTISFFTRDSGRLALNDRGGRSIKGKRGRALNLTHLEITYYDSDKPTAGHLSETQVLSKWTFSQDGALGRLAFSSAVCELLYQLLPEHEPHRDIFAYTLKYFAAMDSAQRDALPSVFLSYLFRLCSMLGYRPVLTGCVKCGRSVKSLEADSVLFAPEQGGLVCGSCQAPGERYIALATEDLIRAVTLQAGSLDEAAEEPIGFTQSTRIIEVALAFLKAQTGVHKLNSLEFIEKLKQTNL